MDLNCEYSDWFGYYTCTITSASITTSDNRTIRSIRGVHKDGKTDKDVKRVYSRNTVVKFFPLGLQKFFPCLTSLRISNCGLKEISRDDLEGFDNLGSINLSDNELTTLPSNLFENKPKLTWIKCRNNKLEFLSSKLLEPIKNNGLKFVDFSNNKSINSGFGCSGGAATIEELMNIIDIKCKAPELDETKSKNRNLEATTSKETHKAELSQNVMTWMTSPHLSDFTIIAGSKKFPVHKWILGTQSSFFAEMFKNQNQETNEMKIEDLSVDAVADFVRFLYEGEFPESKNAIDTFKLAAKLNVVELKLICEKIICANVLNDANAFEVFRLGHSQNSERLKRAGFDKIKSQFPDNKLSESLMQEPEDLKTIMELLKKYT